MARMVKVSFNLDKKVKESVKQVCEDLGISMTEAFTLYAKKLEEVEDLPSEVYDDPFYSESNQRYLAAAVARVEAWLARRNSSLVSNAVVGEESRNQLK